MAYDPDTKYFFVAGSPAWPLWLHRFEDPRFFVGGNGGLPGIHTSGIMAEIDSKTDKTAAVSDPSSPSAPKAECCTSGKGECTEAQKAECHGAMKAECSGKATCPATTVMSGRPVSLRPEKHEFADRLSQPSAPGSHSASRSSSATFAS